MQVSPLSVSPAKPSLRFVNLLIDSFVIRLGLTLIGFVIGFTLAVAGVADEAFWENPPAFVHLADFLLTIVVYFGYYFICEAYGQRTIGKLVTRTLVLTNTGQRPSPRAIAIRTLSRLCPFDSLSFLGRGASGWHDQWSGTCVVQLAPSYASMQPQPSPMDTLGFEGGPCRPNAQAAPMPATVPPMAPVQAPVAAGDPVPAVTPTNAYYQTATRPALVRKSDFKVALCLGICFLVIIVISVLAYPGGDTPNTTTTQEGVMNTQSAEAEAERRVYSAAQQLAEGMSRLGYGEQATEGLRKLDQLSQSGPGRIQSISRSTDNRYYIRINAQRYFEGETVNGYYINEIQPDRVEFYKDGRVFAAIP